jgi:branched-subunit amino acid ABC-type transport system permease component
MVLMLGLTFGGFYALLAGALSLTYRARGFLSFGQAGHLTLATYAAWLLLGNFGIGFWPALLLVPILAAAVAWSFESVLAGADAVRADRLVPTLATLGFSLTVTGLASFLLGNDLQAYTSSPLGLSSVIFGVPADRLVLLIMSAVISLAVWFGTKPVGGNDGIAAHPLAVSAVAAATAGLAAVLMAPVGAGVSPELGWFPAAKALAIVIVAGPRSTGRVMLLGYAAGGIEAAASYYFSFEYRDLTVLALAAVILLAMPRAPRDTLLPTGQRPVRPGSWRSPFGVMLALAMVAYALGPQALPWVFWLTPAALVAGGATLLFRDTGRLSLGHGALCGVAACVTAMSAQAFGLPPEMALGAGVAAATACGLVMIAAALRHPPHFAPAITFVLAALLAQIGYATPALDEGFVFAANAPLFGVIDVEDRLATVGLMLVLLVLAFLVLGRIDSSAPRGAGSERRLGPLLVSALMAGLAGGAYALVNGFVDSSVLDPVNSAGMSLPALLGSPLLFEGAGAFVAALAGTGAMVAAMELIANTAVYHIYLGIALAVGVQILAGPQERRQAAPSGALRFHG